MRKPKQTSLWVQTSHLRAHSAHPFYRRLNAILDRARFDRYVEQLCRKYYAPTLGRPSIAPGMYFRCFLAGCLEGIDSERGIAYRIADSLSLREFLGLSLEEPTPVYDLVRCAVYAAGDDVPLIIPEGAVVVPGSRAIPRGPGREWGLSLYTPVIVKYRDARTDARIQLEELLR